ncbi:MAG: hypothetical protein F4X20_02925 [Dehalococcoidia bacterium]|nr:hypothetical protein [Dehalococcoidia bacterium]
MTTFVLDQNRLGEKWPEINESVLEHVGQRRDLPAHERADRLLRFFADSTTAVGDVLDIGDWEDNGLSRGWQVHLRPGSWATLSWSESLTWDEALFLIDYLVEQKWVKLGASDDLAAEIKVTVEGFRRVAASVTVPDANQGFVAMWFDSSMNSVFDDGILPAIESAGYTVMRIDRKPDVGKIDDETIAEIRRSRFVVADFTQGDDGARGSVYFEAGFAEGLGIPVIYTCRSDMVDKLHFDTRQYAHIVWDNPEELSQMLKDRINARIVPILPATSL